MLLFKGNEGGDGGLAGARKDPESHEGEGLNLIFIIIPVVAVIVITALVALAIYLCRR